MSRIWTAIKEKVISFFTVACELNLELCGWPISVRIIS